ncbi:phospholipase/carboxylesterase [Arboricoccus pini]|uniref:Phospholipase/carboxylesterase n=1 Tax=Arboricoccus pini TaxID=1963835 RepID=A0A212QTG8_9PROT|nr:dienelactone hydrolase family protein [Arboricoccus pini]SNB62930.1 phospholipase/carboxylesterase [Arboricoccus pini]
MLTSERLPPLSGCPPRQLVILLHGLGADGRDMIELGYKWRQGLPHSMFLAPDAPDPCDMSPFGRQWFSLMDRRTAVMAAAADVAAVQLAEFIRAGMDGAGLTSDDVAIVGFSQGMMMAMQVGLAWDRPLAAIVGYSGALLAGPVRRPMPNTPILLVQGEDDEIIPFSAHEHAIESLRMLGVEPKTLSLPGLGHMINDPASEAGLSFLKEAFAR